MGHIIACGEEKISYCNSCILKAFRICSVMRKADFCLYENKGADQLCSNCTADQCLFFFCYSDNAIPPLLIPKILDSSFLLWVYRTVCVRPGRMQNVVFRKIRVK